MSLAGVDHISISPGLLEKLVETPASENTKGSLFDEEIEVPAMLAFTSEPEYRIAFTLSGKGEGERKLTQVSFYHVFERSSLSEFEAINIFCEMQTKLEGMMD
jgi:hypothetical protein